MRVRFGDVVFDADRRGVWRGDDQVHLSPKAFELLKLLLERRPNAVSKAELQEHLWPDTFVLEANLPSLVKEIRIAIGERGRDTGYIRTLHGFGYAFDAPVDALEPPQNAARAWLIGPEGRVPLAPGDNILGREGDGVLVFDSTTVSRRHARICVSGDSATIEDLKSKNGTFVKNVPVTAPVGLEDGDAIRLGEVLLTFRMTRPSASTETQAARP